MTVETRVVTVGTASPEKLLMEAPAVRFLVVVVAGVAAVPAGAIVVVAVAVAVALAAETCPGVQERTDRTTWKSRMKWR